MARFLTIFCSSVYLFLSLSLSAIEKPLWLRYPTISPDGETILFNYKGDIYKVSAKGGTAVPITISDSYEYSAVWSNDGQKIAFASNRYGNFDVFVVQNDGSEAKRLTFHSAGEIPSSFTTDNKNVIFSAVRQDLHTNVQYPTSVMSELYSVPIEGGRVSQILTTPAHYASFNTDGTKLIFHDRKGYENAWRKHHTSAVTRDIWVYDFTAKKYQQLSIFSGEDRNPVFDSNDNDFYYLSEESGSFNIHKSSLNNSSENRILTNFKDHPVRFLSSSDNNKLCFSFDGEIYTMDPGNQAQKVNIQIGFDGREALNKIVPVNKDFTEFSLSSTGKEFAYVFRGEIFVSSIESGTTKRITNTPWQERSVSFSPDGRSIVYAAEVNNSWNIYSKSIVREEESYFFLSTVLKQETIIATPAEEFQPAYSPDGKEISYLENRVTLKVINLESKQTRTIMPPEHNYSYADGDQWYQWSPDSKWFLVVFGPKESIMTEEIGLVAADGTGKIKNLTQSGYYDFSCRWSKDGKMMTWGSTKQGTKGENGFPVNYDIYGMFFTQAAYDRFNLTKEEKELKKEKVEDLKFDLQNMLDRKHKLTVYTSDIDDWVLSKDGDKLYYLTKVEKGKDIWLSDLKKKETKLFAKIGGRRTSMELSEDEKFILVLSDGKLIKVDTKDGKIEPINTKGEMILKKANEQAYIFNHCWRQVREKFYVEDLQGVDWDFYYSEYKKFLPYINNNYDFTEMLSEMLGELNASHTGSGYRYNDPNGDQTASLGLLYNYDHTSTGVKVAEILKGGPLNKAISKIKPGDIIEKIDGQSITPDIDFYQLLNRMKGKNLLLTIYNPSTKLRWDEVVKPISLGEENQLLYKRWVETRRKEVIRLSGGKLGYVHVRGMNDASMRTVYEDALGKHISADALVVDTRFNGGGNLHDVLSDFLDGKKYMDIIPHGQYVGSQPSDKWTKPSIVIMGESNYSDAHLFPVAYKIKKVGKTLGMPVPGTGTFVWWETQIDPTIYFGIPMGGWRPIGEAFLENNQLEPDIKVQNEPGIMASGRDQQLEEAVKELLKE